MKALKFFAVCFFSLCLLSTAKSQDLDLGLGAGFSNIIYQNVALDAMAYQRAQATAQQFLDDRWNYRQQTGNFGYIPGPVSAMQLHESVNAMNGAFDDYNRAYYDQSNRIDEAIGRWSEAFRGDW